MTHFSYWNKRVAVKQMLIGMRKRKLGNLRKMGCSMTFHISRHFWGNPKFHNDWGNWFFKNKKNISFFLNDQQYPYHTHAYILLNTDWRNQCVSVKYFRHKNQSRTSSSLSKKQSITEKCEEATSKCFLRFINQLINYSEKRKPRKTERKS